ncbi:hypothetical protein OEZ85_012605 [Tetradesmus obliquus]|uniref:FAS1 domain-containing protein n=1 Tax=Tetradesmus obliquus TaxID=3088 RepID=A0ABY8U313_TETOB|nr:hypothetical protein OEZ85_012605 [Tetradesmus obliquus]
MTHGSSVPGSPIQEQITTVAAMRSLLVAALVCLALFGNAHAGASFPVNDGIVKPGKADGKPYVYPKGNCGSCSAITAWDYISSTPSLSAVAGLIKAIGLDAALKGPFTGTLALPTNEAVAAYAAQFRGNVTAYPEVFNNFLTKLLTYHFILRSAPAWQLSTVTLSVRYRNVWTATPHTVTFVVDPSVSKRAPGDWQWSRKSMHSRPMPRVFAVTHIVDEQGNNVTFASKDNFVLGGGVIHTINSVLNAYDIFPSVSAAAAGNPALSSLFDVLQQVSAALNISVVDQIDSTPGTLLAPTNDALNQSLSTLPITPTPAQLYAVLQYHFCPAPGGNVKGLLYFKFKANKFNPCLTLLGLTKPAPTLKLFFNQTLTDNNPLLPMKLTVDYLDLGGQPAQTNIVVPDVTTPLTAGHVVDKVLIPPLSALPLGTQPHIALPVSTIRVSSCSSSGNPRHSMRALLVTVSAFVMLIGSASALGLDDINRPSKPDSKPHVSPKDGCSACSTTTAWAYISSTPSLSAVAGLIKAIGLDAALMGPFTGTLVLPTNEAVGSYVSQIKGNVTAYPDIFNSFLTKLLNYHFILRSAPAWQLSTVYLSTRYLNSWTTFPHTVTFVVDPSVSKRAPGDWQWSRKNMKNRPMPRVFEVTHIIDEQGNEVTFASKDNFVAGGGVIHSVNAVLGASDIYPSHNASAAGIPELQALQALISTVSAGLGFDFLPLLEDQPGTLVAPTSEAFATLQGIFASLNITPTTNQLYTALSYHVCPALGDDPKYLLYFPFTKNKKYNPCKTFIERMPGLLFSNTPTGLLTPQELTVTYLNGLTNSQGTSNIVLTGITTPLAVTHIVDTVLVPILE